MAKEEMSVICRRCAKKFRAQPRISLLGFQRFQCPECKATVLYPLLRSSIYWILLAALALMFLFSLLGLYGGTPGEKILSLAILTALYVLERVSYILFPLAAWAVLRLAGMHYPSALQASRTILYYTGIVALFGILIGILGGVASLVWAGRMFEILIASAAVGLFFIFVLNRNRIIQREITNPSE